MTTQCGGLNTASVVEPPSKLHPRLVFFQIPDTQRSCCLCPPSAEMTGMCQDSDTEHPASLSLLSMPDVPGSLLFCMSLRQGYIVFVFLCLSLSLNITSSGFIRVIVGIISFFLIIFFYGGGSTMVQVCHMHLLALVNGGTVKRAGKSL